MTRRSGATLLEVLVAIFVMGIGMLALLTLFPLGALRMAKAIQDDRCAQAGANAQAMSVFANLRNEPGLQNPANAATLPADPFGYPFANPSPNVNPASADGPSYPVFVDPLGWMNSFGTPYQTNLGGGSLIARRSVSFAATPKAAFQWFTLLDDIDFENALPGAGANSAAGTPRLILPVPPNNPVFARDIRYSYAFLCQRPRYADATVVDTAIVVYNQRATAAVGGVSLREYVYSNSTYFTNNNTVQINYGANVPPPVRSGDWILDASPVFSGANVVSAHGNFYRVVGVTDLGGNVVELEVETPLRGTFGPTNAPNGTAIVLEGVAEVFTKGTARLP
jgi:type II secretory pathway pseudopilin PulG